MKRYIVAFMCICFTFLLFGCSDQGITVSFETNGGNQIDTIFLSEWNISQFPVPTRDGYVFEGWYVDEDLTNQISLTMSQSEVTLYAKWTEVTLPTTYTVTFETNGGSTINPLLINEGLTVIEPTSPVNDGFIFAGWYIDASFTQTFSFSNIITQDITLYAKWTEVTLPTTYTVTFETNGGSTISPILINEGLTVIEPTSPVNDGFTFAGWFIDASFTETFNFANIITQDITLYAKWDSITIPTYTITFDSMGGFPVNPVTDVENTSIDPLPTTEKTGYTFVGWVINETDSTVLTSLVIPNSDIVLYAKWQINTYQIIFHSNGGSNIDSINLTYGETIELTQIPTYSGYEFIGWYIDIELNNPFSEIFMPDNHLNLYAKWIENQVSINFDSQGGSPIDTLTGVPGALVSSPLDPIWEDYVFSGWYLSTESIEPYHFDTFPEETITLYADWGTEDLEFVLDEDTQTYGVGIGQATEKSTIVIPKYYLDKPVESILDSGFYDAYNMNVLILPKTIIKIGSRAFMDASSLPYFEIPSSVEEIGSAAFRNCHSLETFTVSSLNLHYESIDGILFSKDLSTLIKYPQAKEGSSYTVPNHVLTIGEDAFSGARNIHTIDLGSGVTTIKTHAFYQTSYLTEIVIPDQITEIEYYAFRECVSLESVTLGAGLTAISSYMFNYCISLEEIIIPVNITSIGYGAFYDCNHLASVYILNSNSESIIQGALFMFMNTPVYMQIYLPNQGLVDLYKTASFWTSYASKITVGNPS